MTLSIDQLRAAFKKPEQNENSRGPNNYFPFWNMKTGESATIRFLPDADDENPMGFLVEKKMHTLTVNGKRVSVPCNSMYGEDCPICKVSQQYYKADDKVNGKRYWRKASYVAQALVVDNPLPVKDGEDDPQGQVRLVSIGYSLYKIIKDTFESGELDEVPFAFKDGTDFVIKKDQQGEHASYVLSKFARKSTDLEDDEIARIEPELKVLRDVLPKQFALEKIEAMLEADISGTPYEDGSASTPSQAPQTPAPAAQAQAAESAPAPVAASAAPVVESTGGDANAEDEANRVIEEIKRRRAAASA